MESVKEHIHFLITISLMLIPMLTFAQGNNEASNKKIAGFLFGYTIKEGQNVNFEKGYMHHLQWHKDNKDPLVWYAWYIITGDRLGWFVDGTFNLSFSDFDHRVKLKEDAEDFIKSTQPFVNGNFRKILRLKKELSTATPLEDYKPTNFMKVCSYNLKPGTEKEFLEILKEARAAIDNNSSKPLMTVYEVINGDTYPKILILFHGNQLADFDNEYSSLNDIISTSNDASRLFTKMQACVEKIYVEAWNYRANLSLIPEQKSNNK